MNKFSTIALVVILSGTVAACDTTGPTQEATKHIGQRDVYNTLEDCVADWGDTDLCTQQMKEAREHAEKMAAAQGGSSGASIVPIFWGPTYYGNDRSVTSSSGQRFTPTTSKASRTANIMNTPTGGRAISYAAPPKVLTGPNGTVTTISRGGFGATGSGISSAG